VESELDNSSSAFLAKSISWELDSAPTNDLPINEDTTPSDTNG
jgi:hypothetical protein